MWAKPGHDTGPQLEALLSPLGYRAFHLTQRGPELKERILGHPEWLNYLFTVREPKEIAVLDVEARTVAGLDTKR